jgi:Anti-sigma factor NepR
MPGGKVVSLGRDVQVKIGQHLRTMYDEVVKQGVPDHLNDLLQKLDNGKKSARDEKISR